LQVNSNALSSLPVSLARLTALETLLLDNNPALPQRMQVRLSDQASVQAFLRPFRCILRCQAVVVALLGSFRHWGRLNLPRDMVRLLAGAIWELRENPLWSK